MLSRKQTWHESDDESGNPDDDHRWGCSLRCHSAMTLQRCCDYNKPLHRHKWQDEHGNLAEQFTIIYFNFQFFKCSLIISNCNINAAILRNWNCMNGKLIMCKSTKFRKICLIDVYLNNEIANMPYN